MTHLSSDDCARWVAGLLEPGEAETLEAHARACPDCEALLQREARVEMKLVSALERAPVVLRPRRPWALLAAPLALAATLALVLSWGPGGTGGEPMDAGVAVSGLPDGTHFDSETPPPEAFVARVPFPL